MEYRKSSDRPRYFIAAPRNFGGPPRWPHRPLGEFNRSVCNIHDGQTMEPNPEHPGYKRCALVKSGLPYLDAVEAVRILNS